MRPMAHAPHALPDPRLERWDRGTRRWGRIDEVSFQPGGAVARSFVNYKGLDASGKYVYSTFTTPENLNTRQEKGESQWAIQMTVRYEF